MQLKPVGEQVVALMGASSGIGRASALRFARRGAKVVASARGEEGLASLVEEIRGGGGEAAYVVADASDFEQVKAVADRAGGAQPRGMARWRPPGHARHPTPPFLGKGPPKARPKPGWPPADLRARD